MFFQFLSYNRYFFYPINNIPIIYIIFAFVVYFYCLILVLLESMALFMCVQTIELEVGQFCSIYICRIVTYITEGEARW